MLHIAVMLHCNFLHLVTSSRTALVTQRCYIIVLCFMSVSTLTYFYWKNAAFFFRKNSLKIFRIKFAIKKCYIYFWCMTPPFSKNCVTKKIVFVIFLESFLILNIKKVIIFIFVLRLPFPFKTVMF